MRPLLCTLLMVSHASLRAETHRWLRDESRQCHRCADYMLPPNATEGRSGTPLFVAMRQNSRSGHQWIATLLAAHSVVTFYEWNGVCASNGQWPQPDDSHAKRLFKTDGCSCLPGERPTNQPVATEGGFREAFGRLRHRFGMCRGHDDAGKPFCSADAAAAAPAACKGVGTFSDGVPWMCCAEQERDCWCAHAFRNLRVFTVERDNAAKNAMPYLRGRCESLELAHPNDTSAAMHYWVEPAHLFAELLVEFMWSRVSLIRAAGSQLPSPLAYEAHFEDFEADPIRATRELMEAIGLSHAFDADVIPSNPFLLRPSPRYESPQDLSAVLLNYPDIVEDLRRQWPCMLQHLESQKPERLPTCSLGSQRRTRFLYDSQRKRPPSARLLECMVGGLGGATAGCTAYEQRCAVDEVMNVAPCQDVVPRAQACTDRDLEACSAVHRARHEPRGAAFHQRHNLNHNYWRVCMLLS